jgi:hypothetical protein
MLDDCWNDLNDFGLFWTVHMNRQDRLGVGKGTVWHSCRLPPTIAIATIYDIYTHLPGTR